MNYVKGKNSFSENFYRIGPNRIRLSSHKNCCFCKKKEWIVFTFTILNKYYTDFIPVNKLKAYGF